VTRADSQTRWDPAQYQRFERERAQPFHDLVARIPGGPVRRAADLGCGTGDLTRTLLTRWPDADVLGVDSSDTMLARATAGAAASRLRFARADLRAWTPDAKLDRIVSNAALQWVTDHGALLARLVGFLSPGGALAVQMPHNDDSPTHEILRALWRDARFAAQLGEAPSDRRVAAAAWYGDRLLELGCDVDVWETVYLHRMDGAEAIVEWVKGTALRPVLSRLDAPTSEAFLALYTEQVRSAYPSGPHGTWFPFRRLFFIATRRGT
jgi:trans-aconitate 2-methyltransferase